MLADYRHVYFLGIGGIGMSALATYLAKQNISISGYDRDRTELTKKLEAMGMNIHYTVDIKSIPDDIDMAIYTPAIPNDQQERVFLESKGITLLKRSECLERVLLSNHVIAVAGTHGKTSTSAILAHLLKESDFSATAFVGGILKNYRSNYIEGEPRRFIVEADEYDRSFLRLFPNLAIIQAMDADHLDIYGDVNEMHLAYRQFTSQIQEGGHLVIFGEVARQFMDAEWKQMLSSKKITVTTFGFNDVDDIKIRITKEENGFSQFDVEIEKSTIRCTLSVPGKHNVLNATAAIGAAYLEGLSVERIEERIKSFEGIERRFDMVYQSDDLVIIDDYAHHPSEIDAVIQTVRDHYPGKHLTVLFQPHTYTRTRDFMKEFAQSLGKADRIGLLDIYAAREEPIVNVNSERLLSLIDRREKFLMNEHDVENYLNKKDIEVLLILGAGDIYKMIPRIQTHLILD